MLPLFPIQKALELSDVPTIAAMAAGDEPYSDFNAVSMFSYDTHRTSRISSLQGNLVLQFPDYITTKPFYTFCGTMQCNETAITLLQAAKAEGITPYLQLIPETTARLCTDPSLVVSEDTDNQDYILSAARVAAMEGADFHKKRNMVLRFLKDYGTDHEVVVLDSTAPDTQQEILTLFHIWERVSGKSTEETEHELAAIRKLFTGAAQFSLYTLGIMVHGNLAAFMIGEILPGHYAIHHFSKADRSVKGIYEYLAKVEAQFLCEHGVEYINLEQDLGIPGLRASKLSFHPVKVLKKYRIALSE